jgi:hypothetical protein
MREVLFKNLISSDSKKKDIFLREVFEKDGVIARTERRYFYLIKDIVHVEDNNEVQHWVDEQGKSSSAKKRHFHILKEHNDELGEERLICKVAGTFYAVVGKEVYTIAFLHSFKVVLMKASLQS